jgi:hypothetical protein
MIMKSDQNIQPTMPQNSTNGQGDENQRSDKDEYLKNLQLAIGPKFEEQTGMCGRRRRTFFAVDAMLNATEETNAANVAYHSEIR